MCAEYLVVVTDKYTLERPYQYMNTDNFVLITDEQYQYIGEECFLLITDKQSVN